MILFTNFVCNVRLYALRNLRNECWLSGSCQLICQVLGHWQLVSHWPPHHKSLAWHYPTFAGHLLVHLVPQLHSSTLLQVELNHIVPEMSTSPITSSNQQSQGRNATMTASGCAGGPGSDSDSASDSSVSQPAGGESKSDSDYKSRRARRASRKRGASGESDSASTTDSDDSDASDTDAADTGSADSSVLNPTSASDFGSSDSRSDVSSRSSGSKRRAVKRNLDSVNAAARRKLIPRGRGASPRGSSHSGSGSSNHGRHRNLSFSSSDSESSNVTTVSDRDPDCAMRFDSTWPDPAPVYSVFVNDESFYSEFPSMVVTLSTAESRPAASGIPDIDVPIDVVLTSGSIMLSDSSMVAIDHAPTAGLDIAAKNPLAVDATSSLPPCPPRFMEAHLRAMRNVQRMLSASTARNSPSAHSMRMMQAAAAKARLGAIRKSQLYVQPQRGRGGRRGRGRGFANGQPVPRSDSAAKPASYRGSSPDRDSVRSKSSSDTQGKVTRPLVGDPDSPKWDARDTVHRHLLRQWFLRRHNQHSLAFVLVFCQCIFIVQLLTCSCTACPSES